MSPSDIRTGIRIAESPGRGRGVFAAKTMEAGEVIARDPVLAFVGDLPPRLEDFEFLWRGEEGCLVLGYGSIYNHSYQPNARYDRDFPAGEMVFTALRAIGEGEEITINYNGDPASQAPLWFETV